MVMYEVTIVWDVKLLILVDIPVIVEELVALICRFICSNLRVKETCCFEMLVPFY
jgi:hypothetical protein